MQLFLDLRLRHGKLAASSLKMVVAEYTAADYGQVGVGPDKVMRELPDKVEELLEC